MLTDYDGPLGALAPELRRRRIAVAADGQGRPVLVRPDSIVVELDGDIDAAEVAARVEARGLEVLGRGEDGVPGSDLLGARRRPEGAPTRWRTAVANELLDELGAAGHIVAPNHVYLADGVARHLTRLADTGSAGTPGRSTPRSRASAARPASPPPGLRPRLDLPGRRRPDLLVLDTGLALRDRQPDHPALRDHCVVHSSWRSLAKVGRWDDDDEADDDGLGHLDDQAGHGTFVSGIIRQICPDARIHHRGVLTSYGDGDDASVVSAIARALPSRRRYDVVVMAFGGYGEDDRPTPMARAIRRVLRRSLVVASAGNDGSSRPAYPAALPGVIGVGALDGDGRAPFSNYGPWVDACAPGADVHSTFFTAFDDAGPAGHPAQHFAGWAMWSGTSFAAPRVAAHIVQEQYLGGGSASDAWVRVRARSPHRVPDLGVALTG